MRDVDYICGLWSFWHGNGKSPLNVRFAAEIICSNGFVRSPSFWPEVFGNVLYPFWPILPRINGENPQKQISSTLLIRPRWYFHDSIINDQQPLSKHQLSAWSFIPSQNCANGGCVLHNYLKQILQVSPYIPMCCMAQISHLQLWDLPDANWGKWSPLRWMKLNEVMFIVVDCL